MKARYSHIPVMKPLLPTADKILPYLSTIDKNRWYSNFGPLVTSLEERFEKYMGLESGTVALVSSATSGIATTMRALNCVRGSYCAIPSWTFAATAAAACNVDMVPYFVDVDDESWAIQPEDVLPIKDRISAVIAVAPFGSPLDIGKWESFSRDANTPVVVDAASCFDSFSQQKDFRISEIPVILSLHATKPFACGEGGLIVCKDKELIEKIKHMSNFGFIGEEMIPGGENAKMSEYAAAVGHAEMDEWESKKRKFHELNCMYEAKLKDLGLPAWVSKKWITSTMSVTLDGFDIHEVARKMERAGIDTRRWWRRGCHFFKAYHDCPRQPLVTTQKLVDSVLGLPLWIGMNEAHVDRVVKCLQDSLHWRRSGSVLVS